MQTRKFAYFLEHLGLLTRCQRDRVLGVLLPAAQGDRTVEPIEQAASSRLACPDCASSRLYRHGHANGLQRYHCRDCGRTCNALSGTPLARLRHKGRWLDYLQKMLDSHSVRRSAALPVATSTITWAGAGRSTVSGSARRISF